MSKKIAILGGGNGGQAFAAYFKSRGYDVALFDFFPETVEAINAKGSIELTGARQIRVDFAQADTDMGAVVEGAALIVVINPSTHHRKLAAELAKHLQEEQIIFINPGATFGSFAFKKALEDHGYTKDVTIAESNVLLFACRLKETGKVFVGAKKDRILVSAFPASRLDRVKEILKEAIPETEFVGNVLATAIDNTNPLVHPAPTILSTAWVESGKKFLFMHEAISPAVGEYMHKMDLERLALGKKLGLVQGEDLFDLFQQYELEYGVTGYKTLSEVFKACKAYSNIYGPTNIHTTRYIIEDVGMGLVPLVSLGEQIGVDVSKMKLIVQMCEGVLDRDLSHGDICRNVENLGIEGMSADQIIHFAQTGEK